MKKVLSIVLSIVMLMSVTAGLNLTAFAETGLTTGSCGENVTYSFDKETGTLTISGTGDMDDFDFDSSPFHDNENISKVVINKGVTGIGSFVFYNCGELESVSIPDSVTSIRHSSFDGCGEIKSINIPKSVKSISWAAFDNCTGLTKITLSNGLCEIGESAFSGCSSLEEIIIPSSVTTIVGGAFSRCISLKTFSLPDGVSAIDSYTFNECYSLESVYIPKSVNKIKYGAFCMCSALKNIYYSGTKAEWEKIVKDYNENEDFLKATIHYNSKSFESSNNGIKPSESAKPAATTNASANKSIATTAAKIAKIKPGKKLIKLTWKKVSGVSGYQIQYSLKKNMKKSKKKTVKGAKKTKVTIKKLKSKKKYYVRIRTYKVAGGKKIYSKWSKIKKVKVK